MEKEIDLEVEEAEELDPYQDDSEEDLTDWKAEAEKYKGMASRYKTERDKLKAKKAEAPKKENKDLDYGQKAFLVASGIKGSEEIELVKQYLASGKELDEIIENKHFQNDLKDLRDDKAIKAAIPSNTKRSGTSTRDSVDYWLAKGELPPPDQVELRRQVVNAKIKSQSTGNPFSQNSVVR
jgi:hypothetical protein